MKKMKQYLLRNGVFYGLALLIAIGLKYHYSRASSDELDWILRPTAGLIEQMSGINFEKEEGSGYINVEQGIIIAPSCAGVNFLIMAFCMAVFSSIHYFDHPKVKLLWLCGSIVSAYLLTLAVNALRIIVAIQLYQANIYFGWFTEGQLHRIEGTVMYFFFLWTFYVILQKTLHSAYGGKRKNFSGKDSENSKSLNFIYAGLIPLFWYSLLILGVPILNAAYRENVSRFIEHCGFVLTGCFAIFIIVFLVQSCWNCIWKRNPQRIEKHNGS